MDLRPHIEKFRRRFTEIEAALSNPATFDNQQRAQEMSKEYSRLKELVACGDNFFKTQAQLAENRALLQSELPDSELAQLAREEVTRLEAEEKKFAQHDCGNSRRCGRVGIRAVRRRPVPDVFPLC